MSQEVCRFCLARPAVSFSLLEAKISHMLESLALSQVSASDTISTIICLKCLLNLKLAYSFQQKIKKSEEKLLANIKVKSEECQEELKDLVQLCEEKCRICGTSVSDSLINDHVREHFNKSLTCPPCDESFTDFHLYREHLQQHHNQEVYQCDKCDAQFQYKMFFDTHINSNQCVESERVQERIKALGLTSSKSIRVLTATESKRKGPKLLHNVDKETTKAVLKLGLKSSKAIKCLLEKSGNLDVEKKDESRTCNICFKTFTKKSFSMHTHETKTCTVCNKEIPKYTYKLHMDNHILGPQMCHLCGATLQNKNNLRIHIFYSHNQLRYKCDQCDKTFKKKNARDIHVQKTHVGVPTLFCETCGKGFYNLRFLNKHVKMTHLKLRPHICEFCQKGFSTQYALKTHRRQHTNETPYRCEVCGEGFRQNVSLRAHRKSKHKIVEETVCHCDVCGKGFASDFALFAHKRLH